MARRPSGSTLSDEEREALRARLRQVVADTGTQAQAADAAGVSLRQIKKYLAGGALPPPFSVVERLAQVSGYAPIWILKGTGKPRATPVGMQDFLQRERTAPDESAEARRQYFRLASKATDALRELYEVSRRVDELEVALQDAGHAVAELVLAGQEPDEGERVERTAHLARVVHGQAHRLARMAGIKTA